MAKNPLPDKTLIRGSGPSNILLVRLKLPLAKRFASACVKQGFTKAEICRHLIEGWLRKVGG